MHQEKKNTISGQLVLATAQGKKDDDGGRTSWQLPAPNAFISRDRGELTYRESIRAFDACAVAYCIVRSLLPRFIPSHRSYPSIDDASLSWALEGVRRILAVVADGLAALDNVYLRSMPANLPSGQVPVAPKHEALHAHPRGSCGRPRLWPLRSSSTLGTLRGQPAEGRERNVQVVGQAAWLVTD